MISLRIQTHISRVAPDWDLSDALPTEVPRRGRRKNSLSTVTMKSCLSQQNSQRFRLSLPLGHGHSGLLLLRCSRGTNSFCLFSQSLKRSLNGSASKVVLCCLNSNSRLIINVHSHKWIPFFQINFFSRFLAFCPSMKSFKRCFLMTDVRRSKFPTHGYFNVAQL